MSARTTFDEANVYAGHPQLTPLEADVLWEYAKLARTLKTVRVYISSRPPTRPAQCGAAPIHSTVNV